MENFCAPGLSVFRNTGAVWTAWEACVLRNSSSGQGSAEPGCKAGPGNRKSWWALSYAKEATVSLLYKKAQKG